MIDRKNGKMTNNKSIFTKTVVLDVETKKGFSLIDWDRSRLSELGVSVVGLYDYDKGRYLALEEREISKLAKVLKEAKKVVGFNLFNFDYQVLKPYFNFNLFKLPTLDILREIKQRVGHRVTLDSLATATLGRQKSGDGLLALRLFRQGKIEALKKYCLEDVKITKELYEYGLSHGVVHFTSRDGWDEFTTPIRWTEKQDLKTVEQIIKEAFKQKKRLQIEYVSRSTRAGEDFRKTRKIDILSIEQPYIEAFCHLRGEKRNFRIDRILKVELLEETYRLTPRG